ncbi:MAG: hypothetical protein J6O73_19025 [Lachnospiraceae bacterium]|nr:hypothetical protein [Lachnospiraceae bacterium]MBO6208999.1 hypothetical protein [Lachnospiraceae bacterium]
MKANFVKAMGVIATVASVAGAPLMAMAAEGEGSGSSIPAIALDDLTSEEGVKVGEVVLKATADEEGNIESLKVLKADGTVDTDFDGLQNVAFKGGKAETLVVIDGEWNTKYDSAKDGAFKMGDNEYYVAGGVVNQNANGLIFTGEKDGFRFLTAGRVATGNKGLVMYNNEWFYIDDNGNCDTTYNAVVDWNDAKFVVTDGQLRLDYTGFVAEPTEIKTSTTMKYYVLGGQLFGDGEITAIGSDGAMHTETVAAGVVK